MASWTVLQEQTVWISPRATSFTVVCDACVGSIAAGGYGAAAVPGSLSLDQQRGWITCPSGHQIRVERDGR